VGYGQPVERHALARDHGLVHTGLTLGDFTVHRNLVARADWNPSMSAAQIWHKQQMARAEQARHRRWHLFQTAGAWVDAQKKSEDDPKN
jgi:hypothetical protein